MAREFAKDFYQSKEWQTVRTTVMANAYGICQRCKKRPGKIVHHIIHLTERNINNPSITLGLNNLIYLCKDCHEIVHSQQVVREGLMFDSEGKLIKR